MGMQAVEVEHFPLAATSNADALAAMLPHLTSNAAALDAMLPQPHQQHGCTSCNAAATSLTTGSSPTGDATVPSLTNRNAAIASLTTGNGSPAPGSAAAAAHQTARSSRRCPATVMVGQPAKGGLLCTAKRSSGAERRVHKTRPIPHLATRPPHLLAVLAATLLRNHALEALPSRDAVRDAQADAQRVLHRRDQQLAAPGACRRAAGGDPDMHTCTRHEGKTQRACMAVPLHACGASCLSPACTAQYISRSPGPALTQ